MGLKSMNTNDPEGLLSGEGLDSLKDNIINSHTSTMSMSSLDDGSDSVVDVPSVPSVDVLDASVEDALESFEDVSSNGSDNTVVQVESDAQVDHIALESASPQVGENSSLVDVSQISIDPAEKEESHVVFDFDEDDDSSNSDNTSIIDRIKALLPHMNGSSLLYYVVGLLVLLFCLLGSAYFYYIERYLYYTTQPPELLDETSQNILSKVNEYKNILSYIGLDTGSDAKVFAVIGDDDEQDLRSIVHDETLSYVDKYVTFKGYVDVLGAQFLPLHTSLMDAKEKLVTYPFFPSLLGKIVNPKENSSLQRSLLSLEGVKFRTALSVFSKFDTFVSQFSLVSDRPKEEIRLFIDSILQRGDKDIDYYLSTCYLNPYEIPDSCMQYGDFARMYQVYGDGDAIDTALFAQMMGFIENKLENSILPSLELSFSDFDTKNQQLTLAVTVNTLPDDSLQLLSSGIINPHVYVIGHMINFLRQSKFVISEGVNINELNIEKILVPIGSKEVSVQTSRFEFVLPLQKNTQREITDFFVESQSKTDLAQDLAKIEGSLAPDNESLAPDNESLAPDNESLAPDNESPR